MKSRRVVACAVVAIVVSSDAFAGFMHEMPKTTNEKPRDTPYIVKVVLPDGTRREVVLDPAGNASGLKQPNNSDQTVPLAETGKAIQAAIDAAAAAGGGIVALESGKTYRSETIRLKSNITLEIPDGAVLVGGEKPDDYDDIDDPRIDVAPENSRKVFVSCLFATNVTIRGGGVIDGRGPCFYDTSVKGGHYRKPPYPRPRMIQFVGCRNVRFEGVTFKDSPGWTCWMRNCEDVAIEGVKVHGDQKMINNDGLHIDGCRRVSIRDCDVRTGDDCIVMRAIRGPGGKSLCEDMTVEDCRLNSSCQCVRLGCPTDGTLRNGVFRRLEMRGVTGILCDLPVRYLHPGESGGFDMEDILFEDCDIAVAGTPLAYRVEPGVMLGRFGNTVFRNMNIRGKGAITLQGTGDSPIENVTFENVTGTVGADSPLRIESARGIVFKNFTVSGGMGKKSVKAVGGKCTW